MRISRQDYEMARGEERGKRPRQRGKIAPPPGFTLDSHRPALEHTVNVQTESAPLMDPYKQLNLLAIIVAALGCSYSSPDCLRPWLHPWLQGEHAVFGDLSCGGTPTSTKRLSSPGFIS